MAEKKNPFAVCIKLKREYTQQDVTALRGQLAYFSRALDEVDTPMRISVSKELESVVVMIYSGERSNALCTYSFGFHGCRCRYLQPPGDIKFATWLQGLQELCAFLNRSLMEKAHELERQAMQYMGAAEHMSAAVD
jgi:hypothetical protein